MKSKINLIAFLLVVTFYGCKKENTLTDFKYTDKPDVLVCDGINNKLYKEALYSFEDDILKFYGKGNPNASLTQVYSQFIRNTIYSRLKYEDIISEHTLKIFEALKNESNLWDANSTKSYLNYNSSIIKCISSNIIDKNLKTTFNALISTNSMTPKLFGTPLMTQYRNLINDKYLATYVALDLYYAKLFDVNLADINFNKPQPLDFNVVPPKANKENQ